MCKCGNLDINELKLQEKQKGSQFSLLLKLLELQIQLFSNLAYSMNSTDKSTHAINLVKIKKLLKEKGFSFRGAVRKC